ncbi:taste receptor type 2 member 40-like [Leptodactylus fuscus]
MESPQLTQIDQDSPAFGGLSHCSRNQCAALIYHFYINSSINVDKRMTFGYDRCPFAKNFEYQLLCLLLMLLHFPDLTDKGLADNSFYESKYESIVTLQRQYTNDYIQSALSPLHHSYIDTEKQRSFLADLVSNNVWFTVTVGSGHLHLSITWNGTLSPPLSSLLISNTYKLNNQAKVGFSQVYVLLAEDLHKSSFFVITMIQLIYQYHQGVFLSKASEVHKFQTGKEANEEPDQRQTLPTFVIVSMSALGISTVMGFFTNSFIILVNGMESTKSRNINPRELILFTLGVFNIAFQCTMVANDTLLFLWSDFYFSKYVYTIFSILLLFTIFSSFWFTFCLCGFYYIMLVTFEKTLFMHLKRNISQIVPWMLFCCILLSLIISVPVAWNIEKVECLDLLAGNITGNFTVQLSPPYMSLQYLLVTSIIGCCIPLILVAIANILIVKSLCSHVTHVRKSSGQISVQSLDASISAVHTVTSLLLLYFSFYVSETLLILDIFKVDSPCMSVCLITVYGYAPVQSVILISGSPNLRYRLKTMIHPCKSTEHMSA